MLTLIAFTTLAVQDSDPVRELEELRRDVELLRTIHSLGLSKEQIEKLASTSKDARKATDEALASHKETLGAMRKALLEYREALEKGETDLRERERAFAELQQAFGEVRRRAGEIQEKLGTDLKAILDERQWRAFAAQFRPDPTRPMREQFARFLDRVREDPDIELNDEVRARFREGLQRAAKHLGLSEKESEAEYERVMKILEEAFKMSGEELAKKRDDLVRRVFEEGKMGEALRKIGPPLEEEKRRAAQIFLMPGVIRFLEKRIERAK